MRTGKHMDVKYRAPSLDVPALVRLLRLAMALDLEEEDRVAGLGEDDTRREEH